MARTRNLSRLSIGLFGSLALHGVALLFLVRAASRPAPRRDTTVELEIRSAPPPRPEPPKPPPRVVPSARAPRPAPKNSPPPPKLPPPSAPPPPNAKPAPHPGPPVPIHIGVSLESTVAASDVAAPVGNSLYGEAPRVAPSPQTASRPYWAPKYVPPYQVAELPVLVTEVKAPYPPEARKAGVEGEVVLMLTVDQEGKVALVKKVSGPGHGLDEAAVAAVRKFVFKPARFAGKAVATEIRYVYSFEID